MATEGESVLEGTGAGQSGTEGQSGESLEGGTAQAGGESGGSVGQAGGESGSAPELPDGITAESLAELGYIPDKDYKSLQSEFSKKTDEYKSGQGRFDKFGGQDQVMQWIEYLDGNPQFADWVKGQQEEKLYGQSADSFDDDTRAAMELVEKIVDDRIGSAMQSQVQPLADSYKSRLLAESFKTMDGKFPDWRQVEGTMESLSHGLSAEVADNPSVGDLEALYFRALAEEGKLVDFGKREYERTLEALKNSNTDKQTASGANQGYVKSNSIAEAFAAGKRKLKLT